MEGLEIAAVGRFVGALGLRRTQVGHRDTVDHIEGVVAVSYTHLDVYKRQGYGDRGLGRGFVDGH